MKAITIWQPWASLIAYGKKTIETRSWPAPTWLIGQRIAIHAAVKWDQNIESMCLREPCYSDLLASGLEDIDIREYLPLGAVIATAVLAESRSTDEGDWIYDLSDNEELYGDYGMGRHGWFLRDVERLEKPIPAKGMQGIWEWRQGSAGVTPLVGKRGERE